MLRCNVTMSVRSAIASVRGLAIMSHISPAYRNMGYGMLPGLEILPNFVPGLHHDVLHLWHRLGEALEALQMVFWRLLGSSLGGLGSPYAN